MRRLIYGLFVLLSFGLGLHLGQNISTQPQNLTSFHPEEHERIARQQPGRSGVRSMPSPSSLPTQPAAKNNEQEKTRAESDPSRRQMRLNSLQQEISNQQNLIQQLEQEKAEQRGNLVEQAQNQSMQDERSQIDSAVKISQLQDQVRNAQTNLQELREKIKLYSSYGFETDRLTAAREEYQAELTRYQSLQAELVSMQVQAQKFSSAGQASQNLQRSLQEKSIEEYFQPRINQAINRLHGLESEYKNLQNQLEQSGSESSS
jgi:DNA repair exonuclease SbcCD ATPase subunit